MQPPHLHPPPPRSAPLKSQRRPFSCSFNLPDTSFTGGGCSDTRSHTAPRLSPTGKPCFNCGSRRTISVTSAVAVVVVRYLPPQTDNLSGREPLRRRGNTKETPVPSPHLQTMRNTRQQRGANTHGHNNQFEAKCLLEV